MCLLVFPKLLVFMTVIIFISIPNAFANGSSLIGIYTKETGLQMCLKTLGIYNCSRSPESKAVIRDALSETSFPNVQSPRIYIKSIKGYFNVTFSDGLTVPKVSLFFMMGQQTEVDIYLANTKTLMWCRSFRSQLEFFSNIVNNSDSIQDPRAIAMHSIQYRPVLETNYHLLVPEKEIQSGRFSCHSKAEQNSTQTIRIFTESRDIAGVTPFMPTKQLTIQNDRTGNGFIVPCRTNYDLLTPPKLLWSTTKQDNLSMLTAKEIRSFEWDPTLGFHFNRSKWMWETKILACKIGSYEKIFLPSPSLFMNLYTVHAKGEDIGCKLSERNNFNTLMVKSNLSLLAKRLHFCYAVIECQLDWDLGLLEHKNRYLNIKKDEETALVLEVPHGIVSCFFQHDYGEHHVPETSYSKFFVGLDSNVYLVPGVYPESSVIQISPADAPLYKISGEPNHEFTCTIIYFVMCSSESVNLTLRHQNKTEETFQQSIEKGDEFAKFNVTLHSNITYATCHSLTVQGHVMSAETPLQIIDAAVPQVEEIASSKISLNVGDTHTLSCPIFGAPSPEYEWVFDKKNTGRVQGVDTKNLTFRQINEKITGNYTCRAWNEFGNISFTFQVYVSPPGFFSKLSRTWIISIGSGALLVFIVVFNAAVVVMLKHFRARRQMQNLTPKEQLEFLEGIYTLSGASPCHELALNLPFKKRINPSCLIVGRDLLLGKGKYGVVYRGTLNAEIVAVKTFKRSVTSEEFRAILVEVKLMDFVNEHPNIVRFIGADISNIDRREILIVMELSPVGSFEKFLRMVKSTQVVDNNAEGSQYANIDGRLTVDKLLGFCEQIASAMDHLASKQVIHGDLAARNILVFHHGVVKVTGFGNTRQLFENNKHKPKKNRKISWRWASIEVLRKMELSTDSDIWAFGVTVWEVFTFGEVPFAKFSYSDKFVEALENGMRLRKPLNLSESQYSFIKDCWNRETSERPRFSVLKYFFSMERQNLGHVVDVDEFQ